MMWMWGPPILTIVLGIFIGWLVKRIIHKRLTEFAEKTEWKGDDILLSAIESHIILWFFLTSFYLVSNQIQFGEPLGQYLGKLAFSALVLSVTFATSRLLTGMLDLWAGGQSGSFPSTKIITKLKQGNILGKPLTYNFLREKKIGGKRIYFLVYEDICLILLIKEQFLL